MTYDPTTPNARRFPRVITPEEIDAMPRLSFNKGIDTAIFLSYHMSIQRLCVWCEEMRHDHGNFKLAEDANVQVHLNKRPANA